MTAPRIPSNDLIECTSASLTDGLVDELLACYIDWRHAAAAAADAYARWSGAPGAEEALRFSAYTAALDQEESSAIPTRSS